MEISQQEYENMQREIFRLQRANKALISIDTEKLSPISLFKHIAINNTGEIEAINAQLNFDDLKAFIMPADLYYRRNSRGFTDLDMRDLPSDNMLHDLIRGISLAAFGTKRNAGLRTRSDQEEAVELYQRIKTVWLSAYEERLERISSGE